MNKFNKIRIYNRMIINKINKMKTKIINIMFMIKICIYIL